MDTNVIDLKSNVESSSNHYLALQLNDFLAHFKELAIELTEQIDNQEKKIEKKLAKTEKYFDEQIQMLATEMTSYKELVTSTNAAHLRRDMEKLFKTGEQHIETLKEVHAEIQQSIAVSCQQFNLVSGQAASGISEALATFRAEDFKQYAENSCRRIEKTSSHIVKRMTAVVNWFHWKNVFLSLAITVVTALMIALYINDEAPWESHRVVKQERLAGSTLMKIWPQLTEADQRLIIDAVKEDNPA